MELELRKALEDAARLREELNAMSKENIQLKVRR